tara:strand:- start:1857 stop:2768 length:912 start_codon:yes stop_codon:yes gene_type:complete
MPANIRRSNTTDPNISSVSVPNVPSGTSNPVSNFWTQFLNWGNPNPSAGAAGSRTNPLQFSPITTVGQQGASMNPYLLGAGAAGSLISLFNRPSPIDFQSTGNFQTSDYQTNPDLLASINALGNPARQLGALGSQFGQDYRQMLDPRSGINQRWLGSLTGQMADMTSNLNRQIDQDLAARGVGSGGISTLLSAANVNRTGEQVRQGFGNILDRSFGAAQNFGNLALGAFGQQGSILGTRAGLYGDIDSRSLQNQQFNVQGKNQWQQYMDMANYNARVQNQNSQQAWLNNLTNMLVGTGAAMGT